MSTVAAVLVTHNAERWLPTLLDSISLQTRRPDRVVAVDDGSSDGTVDLLRRNGVEILPAATTSADVTTRIAQNFTQGVRACSDADIVVLGDHDDVWHANRVAHQVGILEVWEQALMLASDGTVVDADGAPTGGTLRSAFPVPGDWDGLGLAGRMRAAMRASVATGGASALRPAAFPTLDVPAGWLHDRWWSLVAVGRDGLLLDDEPVIDYRVQPGQQLGLDTGAQAQRGVRRAGALVGQGARAWRKARDLRLLRSLVSPDVASEVTLRNVI